MIPGIDCFFFCSNDHRDALVMGVSVCPERMTRHFALATMYFFPLYVTTDMLPMLGHPLAFLDLSMDLRFILVSQVVFWQSGMARPSFHVYTTNVASQWGNLGASF